MSNNNFNTINNSNEFVELIHKLEKNRLIDVLLEEKLLQPYLIRVRGYGRVSLKVQAGDEKVSLKEQKTSIQEETNKQGWDLTGYYEDKGRSGTHMEGRPEFQRMIEDAKQKKFDVIIAWSTDRLARNVDEMTALRAELKKYGVQITTINEPTPIVDPRIFNPKADDINRIINFFHDWKAEQDNVTRTKRFQIGKIGKAKKGKIPVKTPFGYKKVIHFKNGDPKQKIENDVIVENEASVIREIYEHYDKDSWGMRKIAENLNFKGILSSKGKPWCYSSIKYILQNPTYTGAVRYGWRLSESKESRARLQQGHEGVIAKGGHVPIIEFEQFKRVQDKLGIRRKLGGKAVSSRGLLTGILKCGRCGGGTYLSSWPNWLAYQKNQKDREKHKESEVYLCSNYAQRGRSGCTKRYVVSAPKVEKAVIDKIITLSTSDDARKEFAKQMKKNNTKALKGKISSLNKSLIKNEERYKRIKDAYTSGAIDLQEFTQDRKEADNEKQLLFEELEIVKLDLIKEEKIAHQSEVALFALADFKKSWSIASFSDKKGLLQVLLEKIVVNDKEMQIHFMQDEGKNEQ